VRVENFQVDFVDVCLQDPLGVGDEAAVGTEQRFCRAMMIGDDMFPQRTLLATHHLQTLNTACEEHVGVDGCEVLCEFHLPYFHLTGWAGDRGIKIAHALTVPL